MSEPQPSTIREGADIDDEHAPPLLPAASAEDRKAAAALSSLTTANDDETASKRSDADQKALGEAMSRLEVASGKGKAKEGAKGKAGEAEGVTKKKAIKVDQADVALLVEELELSKAKATELLRAHEGDVIKAMKVFVYPVVA